MSTTDRQQLEMWFNRVRNEFNKEQKTNAHAISILEIARHAVLDLNRIADAVEVLVNKA